MGAVEMRRGDFSQDAGSFGSPGGSLPLRGHPLVDAGRRWISIAFHFVRDGPDVPAELPSDAAHGIAT